MSTAAILKILWVIFIMCFGQCRSLELEIVFEAVRWDQASSSCEQFGPEFKPAMVKNEQILTDIMAYIATIPNLPENLWMGLFWNITIQQFSWLDNDLHELAVDYENWRVNPKLEPDNMQTSGNTPDDTYQNCVSLHNAEWMTQKCSDTYYVLCMAVNETTEPTDQTTSPFVSVITTTSAVSDHDTTTPGSSTTSAVTEHNISGTTAGSSTASSVSDHDTTSVTTPGSSTTSAVTDHDTSGTSPGSFTSSAVTDHDTTSVKYPDSSVESTTAYTDNTSRDPTHSSRDSNATSTVPAGSRAIVYCPHDALTLCDCEVVKNVSQGSNMPTSEYVFKVDNKKTRAYLNNHKTVYDERLSARMIGGTGLMILLTVVSLIVCSDLIGLNQRKSKKKYNLPCSR